jgi:hypothetical protein
LFMRTRVIRQCLAVRHSRTHGSAAPSNCLAYGICWASCGRRRHLRSGC